MKEQELNNGSQPALQQTDVSRLLLLFDQMIKEENEALGKAGFYNQYGRETHANNKYCLAIVKSLIERRFGNFANTVLGAITFPKRNTRFKLEDFFQVEVDDFHSGEFLFLSAKKVKTKSDAKLLDEVESFDEYGWVISTWCYDCKYYYKIFVCQYRQKAWKNHYRIESMLAGLNGCDGYAVNNTIEEFAEWMEVSK